MIHYLDNLLHRLFLNRISELTDEGQVRFQPPDEDWRTLVSSIGANSLNVYLADLRENRKLRTNERNRMPPVGQDIFEVPPPRRVDCHYLISAWSPVSVTLSTDPTLEEHALLAEAARVLGEHDELDPVTIYAASTPPEDPPPAIADDRFPITLLPVEGFPKLAEFWGTMGDKHRWKPCVYAVITVALKETRMRAGPMVTTTLIDSGVIGEASTANTLIQFGGTVRASGLADAPPVTGAWVELLNPAPASVRRQLVRTDSNGRFLFVQVAPGSYQLKVSATGLGHITIPIEVPSTTDRYDVHF